MDLPTEFDGREGTCEVNVQAPGDQNWEEVNTQLAVKIGRPAVVIILVPGQSTTYTYSQRLTVDIDLRVVENKGGADIDPFTKDRKGEPAPCDVTDYGTPNARGTFSVSVRFKEKGQCELGFRLEGPGIFDYALHLPAPIVLSAE